MPAFKPKPNKKLKFNKKTSITLDTKHKEFLNEFSKDENVVIPELKLERQELREKIKNGGDKMSLECKLEIEDQINNITEKIRELNVKKKEYFLDNSQFIFGYFENKKNISAGNQTQPVTSKSKMLNNFFKIKQEDSEAIKKQNINNNIVQKYLTNIDDSFLDVNSFICPSDICQICNKGELIPIEDEGILVCNNCYRNVPYLIENEKPS